MIPIIELALEVLQATLGNLTSSKAPAEIIADVEAAIAALVKVQGTPVTMGQLEGLRVKPTF